MSETCYSVAVYQDRVYAATFTSDTTPYAQVYIYGSGGKEELSFRVATEGFVTLSVKNNQIKCCLFYEAKIEVYSLRGELLRTHSTYNGDDARQLTCQYISDDDRDGNVLIVDKGNSRLQVMSEQGEFSVLQLQPPVSHPRSAVLFNNQLYVTTHKSAEVSKYVFMKFWQVGRSIIKHAKDYSSLNCMPQSAY